MAVSYDGRDYHGWQLQLDPVVSTVQGELERSLSFVAGRPMRVQCAGRTDAGVHASHQIVHFDTPVDRDEKAWVFGCNSNLPPSIAVHWAKPVPQNFHARFSALSRRYRYLIHNSPVRPALRAGQLTWVKDTLDVELMHAEAQCLLGEQDFTSFRAVACQSRTPMRNIHFINISRQQTTVIIDIQANAFLHHMVRNIVGVLVAVGCGQQAAGWTADVLAAKDRKAGGVTARPDGLYLADVCYPEDFPLPPTAPLPSG